MKKPASPRTPKHGRGLFGRAASPKKAQQQLRLGATQVCTSSPVWHPAVMRDQLRLWGVSNVAVPEAARERVYPLRGPL